jgi:hypothetical protein
MTIKTVCISSAITAILIGCLAGCEEPVPVETVESRLITEQEKTRRLERENDQLRQQLARHDKQVETLQELGDKRMEHLFYVDHISLGRYTGGWDLDGDGDQDGVKVFLIPYDQYGSVIKAAGDVTVQLYDLGAEAEDNLIGEYNWPVEKMAETWASGFMSSHFTLDCPWPDADTPENNVITVRLVFLEYLTGKTFNAQKTCEIDLTTESDDQTDGIDELLD